MNPITITVCEDNETSLSYICSALTDHLKSLGASPLISAYSSSLRLFHALLSGSRFDLYFLDIDMPNINGLKLADTIRSHDSEAVILFVSAKEEYVFDSIKFRPFRFIRKSRFRADLSEALEAYFHQKDTIPVRDSIKLETSHEIYRFYVDEIHYIQAKDNYLDVVTEKPTLIRYKISEMEQLLTPYRFLRTHKSFLVNYRYIHLIRNKTVLLEDGTVLPVSRYRFNEIQEKFKEYLKCN